MDNERQGLLQQQPENADAISVDVDRPTTISARLAIAVLAAVLSSFQFGWCIGGLFVCFYFDAILVRVDEWWLLDTARSIEHPGTADLISGPSVSI